MYEYPKPPKNGTIKNFSELSPVALERMKNDLALLSSVEALTELSKAYAGKQPPSVNDIYFADAWIDKLQKLPDNTVIAEFETETELIADTYADFLAKRNQLSPQSDSRPSLNELFSVADRWLEKADVKTEPAPDGVCFYAAPSSPVVAAAHGLAPLGTVRFPGSACHAASAYRTRRNNTHIGNCLLALLSPVGEIDRITFENCVASLALGTEVGNDILDLRPCGETGLAYALADIASGAYIDMKNLPERTDGGHEATDLISKFDGCVLIAFNGGALEKIRKRLDGSAAALTVFGHSNLSGSLTVMDGNALLATVDLRILRSPCAKTPIKAVTPSEDADFTPKIIPNEASSDAGSMLLHTDGGTEIASLRINSAIADVSEAPFKRAYFTACTAYFRALASGTSVNKIICSASAELPENPADYGRSVSAALGLFRAQLDLCFRMNGTDLSRRTPDACRPQLALFAASPITPQSIPDKFTGKEHRVCLLQPAVDENGLPAGDELRGLGAYLAKIIAERNVSAAYVFAGITAAEAIGAMSSAYTANVSPIFDAQKVIPFGVLVETDEIINGEFCGLTDSVRTDGTAYGFERKEYTSPIFRAVPTVFIPEIRPVGNADGLEALVRASGGACLRKPYSDTRRGIGELSADMLNADITVFASDVQTTAELLANPRIAYAMSEYSASKRLILVFGEAVRAFADAGLLGAGFVPGDPEPRVKIKLTDTNSPMLSDMPYGAVYTVPAETCFIRPLGKTGNISALTDGGCVCFARSDDGLTLFAPLGFTKEIISAAIRYFS